MKPPARVLIVDDDTLYRAVIREALAGCPEIEVIGVAPNGVIGLEKAHHFRPDVITLDVEMPDMNGLEVLDGLQRVRNSASVILLSGHTAAGTQTTVRALTLGAFDAIQKPVAKSPAEGLAFLRDHLVPRILAGATAARARGGAVVPKPIIPAPARTPAVFAPPRTTLIPRLLAIGSSTGGPEALRSVLPKLPADFPLPIVVIQHMPPTFTASLASTLRECSKLNIQEARDGARIERGTALIAPGGKQMRIVDRDRQLFAVITDDPPEQNCQPSIDYSLRYAAEACDGRILAVILTGMGRDGCEGCRTIHARGGRVLAQDEATSVVYGMPRAVIEERLAERALPLGEIAAEIQRMCGKRPAVCV